jgi:hypothetical protein
LSGIDHKHFPGPEHDFEPEPGLPERLPETEQLLWQGQPDTAAVARSVFHIRAVAAYFLALLVWKLVADWHDGASLGSAAWETLKVAPLPMAGLGLLYGLAHLTARTTLYTITSKRVVLRIGIVLSVTFNLPFSRIAAADLRRDGSGHGDVSLRLAEGERIAHSMQGADIAFLGNHGVIVCGPRIDHAYDDLYYLERACMTQVLAQSSGRPLAPTDSALAARVCQQVMSERQQSELFFEALRRRLSA